MQIFLIDIIIDFAILEMLSHSEIVDLRPVSRLRSSNAMLQYEERSLGEGAESNRSTMML